MALKDYYYTLSQAAKEAGVTRQTVARWIADDNLNVEKVGRETLIKKDDFKEYIFRQRIERDASDIISRLADIVRETYNYSKADDVEYEDIEPKKNLFHFVVSKEDGGRERVDIELNDPKRIDIKSKETVYVGMQFAVNNISKRGVKS